MRKLRVALPPEGSKTSSLLSLALGVAMISVSAAARAEVEAVVAVGGGQRGAQSYASVEGRLDLALGGERWQLRTALAARGQWDDGQWRREDVTTARGWVGMVRYLEWWQRGGGARGDERAGWELAAAAGMLRPAAMAHVSDGVQTAIDDRPHSGLRARGRIGALELSGEIDDGFAPRLLALEVGWRTEQWRATAAMAMGFSPWGQDESERVIAREAMQRGGAMRGVGLDVESAFELSLARRFVASHSDDNGDGAEDEGRLGVGAVAEPGDGVHALAFAELWADSEAWRVVLRADVRAGTGSLGAKFGPLYRLERLEQLRAQALDPTAPIEDPGGEPSGELEDSMSVSSRSAAVAAGVSLRIERETAWFEAQLRTRRSRGAVVAAHLGVPITERAQLGAWAAADAEQFVLASEARVFGKSGTFAAVEVSRLLRTRDASSLELGWAVVGWVGIGR